MMVTKFPHFMYLGSWDGYLQVPWSLYVRPRKHLPHQGWDFWCKTGKDVLIFQFMNFRCAKSGLQLVVLQCHQERDPIERVRKLILAHGLATAAELKVRDSFGNISSINVYSKPKWYLIRSINSEISFNLVHFLVLYTLVLFRISRKKLGKK